MSTLKIASLMMIMAFFFGCQQYTPMLQTDRGGPAVHHTRGAELPPNIRPNDATISLYNDKRINFIELLRSFGNLYTVKPKGNAVRFKQYPNPASLTLEKELSEGYILNYVFYDDGVVKYNGKAATGRLNQDVDDEALPMRTVHANQAIKVPSGRQAEQIKELININIAHKTNKAGKIMNFPPIDHESAIS